MALWSLAILVLSVLFLALRHRKNIRSHLPPSFSSADWQTTKDANDVNGSLRGSATIANGHIKGTDIMASSDDDTENDNTPKAQPRESDRAVPVLSLSESPSPAQDTQHDRLQPAHVTPALSTAHDRIGTSLPIPPKATQASAQNGSTNLMPPPPRPPVKTSPNSASALRVPSSGPLPNRGPPSNSQQRVSGGLSPNVAVPTPNKRGKVLLSPGHSPMDWADLTRRSNLSGVDTFQRVTPSVLKSMTGRKGKAAWSSWQGKVYNITPYLPFHPGGEPEIMKAAGRDGEKLFMEVHPWVNWENMLGSCLVGVLVPENYAKSEEASSLEALD